ncbi:hypothetical protein PHYPSEUDO_005421 [Phytophthora pseudosyringae]|uniref:Uncharacterized protein n=1 Tax=Phytophthora pseudosyringae TaxID=221518 RepID=A0A8T1VPI2_9STRA|nr:hypothetical protein PHYPSEUDO_005421 [Phytophthora pseudosyringae]
MNLPPAPPLRSGSSLPGPTEQPMIHYLFLDLDSLLATVKTHMLAQPTVYPQDLTRVSGDGVLLHPERLTALLDGQQQQQQQQPVLVLCRSGSYFNGSLENAQALQAIGWNLKKKGAPEHRTLENLMERNLAQIGACSASKTMVLATGELKPPTQSCILAYLQSGWHVKLYCLQRCWKQTIDDLEQTHQELFKVVYLDGQLRELLANSTSVTGSASTSVRAANREMWSQIQGGNMQFPPAPHARALALAAASPSPFRFSQRSWHVNPTEDNAIRAREQNAAERRQSWLAKLPKAYRSGHRERYVFLNVDNVAGALFSSQMLYRRVDGATCSKDVRLNFRALTKYLCGDGASRVKCQLAGYCKTSPYLTRALVEFGWTLKPRATAGSDNNGLHYEMMLKFVEGTSTANEKTLVLAMGDGRLGGTNKNAYREIIGKFLERRWYVEIYAWLHALNDGFLELQAQYPGRVVVKPLDDNIGDLVYPKSQETTRAFAWTTGSQEDTSSLEDDSRTTQIPRSTSPMSPTLSSLLRPVSPPLPSPPQPSIVTLQQQIQHMQDAFAELQTSVSTQQQLQQHNEELERSMREQASYFEEERGRQATVADQQAKDARLARRLQLEEREESLTCPITCDLYEEPTTTICCGKTFSAVVLERLDVCPWCRTTNLSAHPNRDVASLVAQYRVERDALDADEQSYDEGEAADEQ